MWAYRAIRELVRLSTFVFFRRVEVVGVEHIPQEGAVVFFGNHPNSLLDPALITAFAERKVHFAAKDTLFSSPPLRWILSQMGAVPIRRRSDHATSEGAQLNNDHAFSALHELLQRGDAMGIFPEGVSHDGAQLVEFKTGAARIALGALTPSQPIKLVPCGLHYFRRKRFRSAVLIQFGAPITLTQSVEDTAEDTGNTVEVTLEGERLEVGEQPARELTGHLERSLRALTVNAESWEELSLLDAVRRLYQPPNITLEARVELARRFALHYPQLKQLPEITQLTAEIERYREDLYALGLRDRELSANLSTSHLTLKALKQLLSLSFWAPLALIGAPIHFPIAYALGHGSWLLAPRKDVVATTKFLAGFVCLNALYVGCGALVWWQGGGWLAPLTSIGLALSGLGALKVADRGRALSRVLWVCARCLFAQETLRDLRARRRALRELVWSAVDAHAPEEMERLFERDATSSHSAEAR